MTEKSYSKVRIESEAHSVPWGWNDRLVVENGLIRSRFSPNGPNTIVICIMRVVDAVMP